MAIRHQLIIDQTHSGRRLDSVIAELLPDYSRSLIKQWINEQAVVRNGQVCRPRDPVITDDVIEINATVRDRTQQIAQAITLDILHEDEALIIVNKPAGLVVHPGNGNWQGTLVNALLHHCPELAHLPRAGLIHRIDKDTSGLLAIAKTLASYTSMVNALQQREVKRQYVALVQGEPISGGTINIPIARHPRQRTKMSVMPNGKEAITHYRLNERFKHYTLLDVQLETGRTHQIRVHLAHAGYPLVGDSVYNPRYQLPKKCPETLLNTIRGFKRQALHAHQLGLIHPQQGQFLQWTAPLPEDMLNLIDVLRTWQTENGKCD